MAVYNKIAKIFSIQAFQQILLLILVVATYYKTIKFGFIWDDDHAILQNRSVQDPTGLFKIWSSGGSIDFWPITYSYYWIENYFFKDSSLGYHACNLILFFIQNLLILKLLKMLKLSAAFWVTLIFAVHPMNVEVVAWVTQSKTLLANIFGTLSFIYWLQLLEKKSRKNFFLSAVFFVLSLLSKINLIFLPVLMIGYQLVSEKNLKNFKNIALSFPFFLLSLLFGLVNIFWYRDLSARPAVETILEKDFLFRFILVGQNFWFYLCKSLLPYPLMLVHPRQSIDTANFWLYVPSITLIIFILITSFKIFYNRKISLVTRGFLVSFFILIPVLGIVEIYFMRYSFVAEHWLGVALLGFLAPIVEFTYSKFATAKYLLSIAVLVFFGISFFYVDKFYSNKDLIAYNYSLNTNSTLVNELLALEFKHEGNLQKSLELFQQSSSIQPSAESYFNIASIYDLQSQRLLAESNYLLSIELNPNNPQTYVNLGILYARQKNYDHALAYLKQAIAVDPNYSKAYYNTGYIYKLIGDNTSARSFYIQALQVEPENELYKKAVLEISK